MKRLLPLLLALPLCAAEVTNVPVSEPSKPLLALGRVSLVQVDVEPYASYSKERGSVTDIWKHGFKDGTYGAGLAATTWFGDHVGVRLSGESLDAENVSGIDYASVTGLLRFPTTLRLDPYAGAGVGFDVERERYEGQIEAGLYWRVMERFYARGAYRHTFGSKRGDWGSILAGVGVRF